MRPAQLPRPSPILPAFLPCRPAACLLPLCLALLPVEGALAAGPPQAPAAPSPAPSEQAFPLPEEVQVLADEIRERLAKAMETSPTTAAGAMVGLDALAAPPSGGPAVLRPLDLLKGGAVPAGSRPAPEKGTRDEARAAALSALAEEFVRRIGPAYGGGTGRERGGSAPGREVSPGY